jgi:hypothetical protein
LRAAWLQVQYLVHSVFEVDVMTAFARTKAETAALKNVTQVAEVEVRVRASFEQASE